MEYLDRVLIEKLGKLREKNLILANELVKTFTGTVFEKIGEDAHFEEIVAAILVGAVKNIAAILELLGRQIDMQKIYDLGLNASIEAIGALNYHGYCEIRDRFENEDDLINFCLILMTMIANLCLVRVLTEEFGTKRT